MRRSFLAAAGALSLALLSAPGARSDIIILDDGTVIECKIREIKYPDPKVTTKFIVIAAVDEKGTIRQFKSDDIKPDASGAYRKAIWTGKTRWEKRADYLKEYSDSKLKYVRDTWESHQQLGKWCKSHYLGDKSDEHYRKAYKLRSEQMKTWLAEGKIKPEKEVDEHLKLAKWCEKDLGLYDEAKGEYASAYDFKKKAAGEMTADAHFAMGKWCEAVGLDEEAMKEYEATVALKENHSQAKAAITRIVNSIEYKTKQFAVEYDKGKRAWHFTVAIEDAADRKFMDLWARKIQDLSDYMFEMTEGQFYIADCEIEDNTSDGKIIIEKGKMNWRGTGNAQGMGVLAYCVGSGSGGWQVHAAGLNGVSVIAHEVCHGIFGLPDEYYQNPQCDCVMRAAPNPHKLCDGTTHIGGGRRPGPPGSEGKDCWKIIVDRREWSGPVAHPNTNWTWAEGSPARNGKPEDRGHADGPRGPGGELKYKGIKLKEPPRTVVRIIDN